MINESPLGGEVIINKAVHPVIVYQMGKVGSRSILDSLARLDNMPFSLYHTHALSAEQLEKKKKQFQNKKSPEDLQMYQGIKDAISAYRRTIPWKIITLAREPVSLFLSSVFQTMWFAHGELLKSDGTIDVPMALSKLESMVRFEHGLFRYIFTWFDMELKNVFDIDIYSYDYDFSQGYRIIIKDNIEVLVIRMEDINRSVVPAMEAFLGIDGFKLFHSNLAEKKWYAEAYKEVKSKIVLEKEVCEKIYSTKYARHFYTDKEVAGFMKKWVGPKG